nr:MAG: nucleotide binding protein [Potato virus M]
MHVVDVLLVLLGVTGAIACGPQLCLLLGVIINIVCLVSLTMCAWRNLLMKE